MWLSSHPEASFYAAQTPQWGIRTWEERQRHVATTLSCRAINTELLTVGPL